MRQRKLKIMIVLENVYIYVSRARQVQQCYRMFNEIRKLPSKTTQSLILENMSEFHMLHEWRM
jgi:hypothetical protein